MTRDAVGSAAANSRCSEAGAWQATGRRCVLNLMKRGATVIEVDPEVLGGTPVFAGTCVLAEALLEYLERGRSLAELVADGLAPGLHSPPST